MKKTLKFLSNKKVSLILDIISYCLFAFLIFATIMCYITGESGFWSCVFLSIILGIVTFIPINRIKTKASKINKSSIK